MQELIGHVDRIRFRNEETGWTVLSLRDGDQNLTVTGNFTGLAPGEYVRLMGDYSRHPKYGLQFTADRKVPHTRGEGIVRYLVSRKIHGIGQRTAEKIVEHFGEKTLDILDREPERLEEVPTIGQAKLLAIMDAWEEPRAQRAVELFLMDNQLPPRLAQKILTTYGERTLEVVTKFPYQMALDIRGIGFRSADHFAMTMGIAKDAPERVKAAIIHCLKAAEDQGHCYQSTQQLAELLGNTLAISEDKLLPLIKPCCESLVAAGYIVICKDGQEALFYQRQLYEAEKCVADRLLELSSTKMPIDRERSQIYDQALKDTSLSEDQIAAIHKAVHSKISILTGGPGVGKSTTVNFLLKVLQQLGLEILLGAPTGRAAQRLSEITGAPAKTIHRLLEWNPTERGFKRNREQPLTAAVVIIDEVSMLDINLAAALLDAIDKKTQLVLIGDSDQLPSVGPGNFLSDLLKSEQIPTTRLTKVFRQAAHSDIVNCAHAINNGIAPIITNQAESDMRFIACDDPDQAFQALCRLVTEILPRKTNYDIIADVQILTPMKRTTLGVQNLNKHLQQLLNPPDKSKGEYRSKFHTFRDGDKVIQTSNNYELGVFNGDIGRVVEAGVMDGKLRVSFGDRDVVYDHEKLSDLQLAYAITIHKSQGSEFPVVILPLSTQHYIMLERNLLYTGLTRAKKLGIFVGSSKAMGACVRTETRSARCTRLAQILKEKTTVETS